MEGNWVSDATELEIEAFASNIVWIHATGPPHPQASRHLDAAAQALLATGTPGQPDRRQALLQHRTHLEPLLVSCDAYLLLGETMVPGVRLEQDCDPMTRFDALLAALRQMGGFAAQAATALCPDSLCAAADGFCIDSHLLLSFALLRLHVCRTVSAADFLTPAGQQQQQQQDQQGTPGPIDAIHSAAVAWLSHCSGMPPCDAILFDGAAASRLLARHDPALAPELPAPQEAAPGPTGHGHGFHASCAVWCGVLDVLHRLRVCPHVSSAAGPLLMHGDGAAPDLCVATLRLHLLAAYHALLTRLALHRPTPPSVQAWVGGDTPRPLTAAPAPAGGAGAALSGLSHARHAAFSGALREAAAPLRFAVSRACASASLGMMLPPDLTAPPVVAAVLPGSPAADAGLCRGMRILRIDTTRVTTCLQVAECLRDLTQFTIAAVAGTSDPRPRVPAWGAAEQEQEQEQGISMPEAAGVVAEAIPACPPAEQQQGADVWAGFGGAWGGPPQEQQASPAGSDPLLVVEDGFIYPDGAVVPPSPLLPAPLPQPQVEVGAEVEVASLPPPSPALLRAEAAGSAAGTRDSSGSGSPCGPRDSLLSQQGSLLASMLETFDSPELGASSKSVVLCTTPSPCGGAEGGGEGGAADGSPPATPQGSAVGCRTGGDHSRFSLDIGVSLLESCDASSGAGCSRPAAGPPAAADTDTDTDTANTTPGQRRCRLRRRLIEAQSSAAACGGAGSPQRHAGGEGEQAGVSPIAALSPEASDWGTAEAAEMVQQLGAPPPVPPPQWDGGGGAEGGVAPPEPGLTTSPVLHPMLPGSVSGAGRLGRASGRLRALQRCEVPEQQHSLLRRLPAAPKEVQRPSSRRSVTRASCTSLLEAVRHSRAAGGTACLGAADVSVPRPHGQALDPLASSPALPPAEGGGPGVVPAGLGCPAAISGGGGGKPASATNRQSVTLALQHTCLPGKLNEPALREALRAVERGVEQSAGARFVILLKGAQQPAFKALYAYLADHTQPPQKLHGLGPKVLSPDNVECLRYESSTKAFVSLPRSFGMMNLRVDAVVRRSHAEVSAP